MNVLVVDDEYYDLIKLEKFVNKVFSECNTYKFINSLEAFEFAKNAKIDLAFLDITIPFMNGIELARKLKNMNNDIAICFVSGYDKHKIEEIHHLGYIEKPFDLTDVKNIYEKYIHYRG